MKRIKCLILLFIIFLCCSCVKYETNVTVSSDKSVNFEINLGYSIESGKKIDIEELKNAVNNLGFSIDSFHDNNYTGYRLLKKYKNINEISKNKNEQLNLANILQGNFDEAKLYKVKKSFFKNTYYANYIYDFSNLYDYKMKIYLFKSNNQESVDAQNYLNEIISQNSNFEIIETNIMDSQEKFDSLKNILNNNSKNYEKTPVIIIGNNIIQGYDEQIKNDIMIEINDLLNNPNNYTDLINDDFNSNYDLSYNINLPNEAIKNNADEVVNDGKSLSWKLNYFSPVNIEYSFELVNKSSIIIIILISILLIIIVILSFYFYKLYKENTEKNIQNNTNIDSVVPEISNEENTIISIENLMKK